MATREQMKRLAINARGKRSSALKAATIPSSF
jgi:hypothetical protein